MGSDHDVYQEGSFRIPAIYMNDWPDRYIHTNFDSAANIDPTKLKRAAFIGATSGYFLAQLTQKDEGAIKEQILISAMRRHAAYLRRSPNLSPEEMSNIFRLESSYLRQATDSFAAFVGSAGVSPQKNEVVPPFLATPFPVSPETPASDEGRLVFARSPQPKGPLAVFGYDYFEDHAKAAGIATPKLLSYQGLWGAGEEYAYETLNFVDGKRNAQQIRDAVSAEYGPVPLAAVIEYLKALEKIGVISKKL
jgi:aminopeptidase YwaD